MQLKSLEIHGFKSFADKTLFLFDKGITGIVGPNGCGKSNIVDSMRWVLGEQKTRKLRSEKMENVIFNGTSKRKKAHFAEVVLTFENTKNILPTEFTTVAISRKLYRTGESEYMINGVACRLKDIHDLFLDTGIGPDSYAIIELKMVDDILNDKENSRRILFEEAAGISKYKIRKKQTLKKLEETQDDLERVEDILFEIQKQLKSLEAQAKKARKYFEIKCEYKLVSSRHAYFAIRGLRGTYETIEKEEQSFGDKLGGLQSTIAKHEARLQELRKEQIDNENRLSASQKDLNAHITRIQEIEKEKSIKNERLKYLQQREFAIGDQLEKDRKNYSRIKEELESVTSKRIEVAKLVHDGNKLLATLKAAKEDVSGRFDELKLQTEGYAEVHRTMELNLSRLEKDREIKLIQIDGLTKEIERNEADRTSKTDELDSFAGTLETLTLEVAELETSVNSLRALKTQNDADLEASSKAIDQLKDAIYKSNRGLDSRQNEYNLTKSLVENLEGFPDSVKFLKKEASWIKEAPLLGDIFLTSDTYKVALENLLDPYMSYYVVDTSADAMQAIQLLANTAKGRANFFVLEELNTYPAVQAKAISGATSALELVEVAEKYQALAAYLLDNVYMVEDEAAIPAELPEQAFFLTKSGSMQRKKYAIGGGSIGLFQGKRLGRAKNLEKLAKEIKQIEKELSELKNSLVDQEVKQQQFKANDYGRELETQNNLYQRKHRDLSVLQAREKEYRDFITRAGERSEIIERQIVELEQQTDRLGPQIVAMREDFSVKAAILEEARRMFENCQADLSEKSQAFNTQNILCIQQKNQLDMLERDEQQKQSTIKDLEESEEKNRRDLQETKDNIHSLVQNNLQNDDEMVALYEQKKAKEDHTGKLEQIAGQMRSNINATEDQIRAGRKEKEEFEEQKNAIKDRVTDIKIQLNSLKERMKVEFDVDISDLDESDLFEGGIDEYAPDAVEHEMVKLRQKLQTYGEINPMAVEAYDEMKERFDFINTQKTDLMEARKTLLDTISEIDTTATEKFTEAFTQIRKHFKEVFQHLFYAGDTCDLELSNPEDVLESPIDIMAKPKGKRPLSINQLSGGEKTLTAVALLFAIYLLKPAPFCIFDEVDAPLDDANIDKFNNIIREFSKDSQFIIVTHNKRTMAATNVMYGVTMEATGISKVLPVDLVALNLTE
jgi:chromosome segregation protein